MLVFMSASMVLCQNLVLFKKSSSSVKKPFLSRSVSCSMSFGRRRFNGIVPFAKKRHSKRKSWWFRFFFDEDGNWLGFKDKQVLDELETDESNSDEELSENDKFEAWKRRAEAIVELREAQQDLKNEENRMWEDWIVGGSDDSYGNETSWSENGNYTSWSENSNGTFGRSSYDGGDEFDELFSGRRLMKSVRDLVVGREDDDILYEDRVFQFAALNSAKFLAVVIIAPWSLDFLVHDYVLMPFLDRYVNTVPLASQMLDVRKTQKLQMVKALNIEKARYHLEVEIGKSPPLSDEELYMELRHKALELRDEWRLENRAVFANIWSDLVFGVSSFILLYFNQDQVALLKFTGYKLVNNISDTGKAFLIILTTDIFLGYHSASGWQTLLEVIFEHYGFEVDQVGITIFVCLIPVIMDACVKLWMFKFLPRLSPKVANIFREMQRH